MARLVTGICLLLLVSVSAHADLSQKEARGAIAKAAGFSLPRSAVRVEKITSSESGSAEVSAELQLVFRLARDDEGWAIKEVRSGEAQWEDVDSVIDAAKLEHRQNTCNRTEGFGRFKSTSDLDNKRARCLVATLFSVDVPADAVRIKEISRLNLGSKPSALVVSFVHGEFRLMRDAQGWRVVGLHTGSGPWVTLESLPSELDSLRKNRTTAEMNTIAAALEEFRRDRGSFVVTDKHHVLVDHLNPRYLNRVIRVDAWHRPFRYEGSHDHFTLRSLGPDGRENTPDDIVVAR